MPILHRSERLSGDALSAVDVFISYARSDASWAEAIARCIANGGHSVWVDKEQIRDGDNFDTQIEDAIAASKVVIVLWSATSVKSRWVRAEAAFAQKARKLVPVILDGAEPPLQFLHNQSIDFYDWDRSPNSAQTLRLLESLSVRLGTKNLERPHPVSGAGGVNRRLSALTRILSDLYLRFPDAEEEANFQAYYRQRVYSAAQFAILLGAICYLAFGITDELGLNGELGATRFRFLVACPTLLAFYGASFTTIAKRHLNIFMTVFCLIAICLVYVTTLQLERAEGVFRFSNGFGTMNFIVLISFLPMIQLQTINSVFLGLVGIAVHTMYLAFVARLGMAANQMDTLFVFSAFSVACCTVYWREQSHRKAFASRSGSAKFF